MCPRLMDERWRETRREVVIVNRGRPMVRLAPVRRKPRKIFGMNRARIEIPVDITDPIHVQWHSETNLDRIQRHSR